MLDTRPFTHPLIQHCREIFQSWAVPADEIPPEFFQFGYTGVFRHELLGPFYYLRSYSRKESQAFVLNFTVKYIAAFLDVYHWGLTVPTIVWREKMPPAWQSWNSP